MIRQLMREQFRAHRASLVWTTLLLTVAMTAASFTAFTALQNQVGVSAYVNQAYGLDRAWGADTWITDGDAADPDALARFDALTQAIDEANADGNEAAAMAPIRVFLAGTRDLAGTTAVDPDDVPLAYPDTLRGAVDWEALLTDGSAPGSGEVAVDAEWAAGQGLTIGDRIAVGTEIWSDPAGAYAVPLGDLRISGLLRTSLPSEYNMWISEAFVGWDTIPVLEQAAASAGTSALSSAVASADRPVASEVLHETGRHVDYWSRNGSIATIVVGVAAGVLILGLIGVAFALGRSQAQMRTGWISTARALGARRSAVAAATTLEVLAVGAIAGGFGIAAGYAVSSAAWSQVASSNPDALAPASMNVPWWVAASLAALALLVAGILGGIPAFWASRVSPSEALKPSAPLAERAASRHIPLRVLLLVWGPVTAVGVAGLHTLAADPAWAEQISDSNAFRFAVGFAFYSSAAVLTPMLVIELARLATNGVTRLLERGAQPWQVAAAAALRGRPRQASGPAAVLALASAVLATVLTILALQGWADRIESNPVAPGASDRGPFATGYVWGWGDGTQPVEQWAVIVAFGALTLVLLAAHLSQRAASRDESIAQGALGLSHGQARAAAAAEFGLPLLSGVAVGAAAGVFAATMTFTRWLAAPVEGGGFALALYTGPGWAFSHLGHAVLPLTAGIAVVVSWVLIGSAIAAFAAAAPRVGSGARRELIDA